jgi:glycerophosphoryl diester phosphodiesterase
MRYAVLVATSLFAAAVSACPAHAFDLQGHRGARGLVPENTIAGFARALETGVTTLELDLAVTKDGVVVVSHDLHLNPAITRSANGEFLTANGPAIHSLTFEELQRYDVGRLKPGTAYAKRFPEQQPVDGARIPPLRDVFDLVKRAGADHIRFNIETKITPTSGADTPNPETFAKAVTTLVQEAGLAARATVQSFDWRTLAVIRKIAPDIERACLSIEADDEDNIQRGKPGPSPWTAAFDIDDVGGSAPRLVQAAGCAVWSPYFRNVTAETLKEAKALGLKTIPWTVNEPADMQRLIDLGVDGIISDYPDRLRTVMQGENILQPPAVTPR